MAYRILIIVLSTSLFFSPGLAEETQKTYQRIISLSPQITESLFLLEADKKLVGCTTYCLRPDEAKTKEKVGNVTNISVEKIFQLRPDLIFVTPLSSKGAIQHFKKLKIPVVNFPEVKNFDDVCQQFKKLGELTQTSEKANKIIAKAKLRFIEIKKQIPLNKKPKVFFQIGAKPLFTVKTDSFLHDLIIEAGAINVAEDSGTGLYSREKVIKANPDFIFIVTMGITADEETRIWKNFGTLSASKNNHIYILDSYKTCSPTPLSFVEVFQFIVTLLYPEKLP